MYIKTRSLVIFLILFYSLGYSQTSTFSPYSRYGFGDLYREGKGSSIGMGGTGIGTRMKNQINFLNPAAYTTQDTSSFIMDFGFDYSLTNYETNSSIIQRRNADFSHIALSFPVFKWWTASMGAVPYSKVGYDLIDISSIPEVGYIKFTNKGSGGLNRYYIGSGFKFKNLSVGFNANYLLGSIEINNSESYKNLVNSAVEDYYSTYSSNAYSVRNLSLSYGAQYTLNFKNNITAVIGVSFEPKENVSAYRDVKVLSVFPSKWSQAGFSIDTVVFKENIKTGYDVPSKLGIGTSLNFRDKLLLCIDYSKQDWTNYNFPLNEGGSNTNGVPTLSQSYNFGLQYTPNNRAIRGYLNHVNYRIGAHFADTYMKFKSETIKDYGFSCGLGLPFLNSPSVFHINYEYGRRGTLNNNLLRETYHYFYFSLTLYDFWFIKTRYD